MKDKLRAVGLAAGVFALLYAGLAAKIFGQKFR